MVIFLLFLVVLAALLQYHMGAASLEKIACSIRSPDYLVEPDAPFTIVVTVENRSRLPVLFLRCSFHAPAEVQAMPENRGELLNYVNFTQYQFTCFLMPRQKLEHKARLKLSRRGGYQFGSLQVCAGDFLGLREEPSAFPGSCGVVILPKRKEGSVPPDVFGGLVGERSVRRWIHEDPILSAGFREYTGREPMKTISWNRSLQSGQWMVRRMDHTAEEKVTVLLSLNGGTWEDREECFRICREVCEQLESRRLPYAFLHNGMLMTSVGVLPPVEAGLGGNHLGRILEGLGRAVPEVSGDLGHLMRRALARRQEISSCVLIVPGITDMVRREVRRLERQTGCTVEIISGEAMP